MNYSTPVPDLIAAIGWPYFTSIVYSVDAPVNLVCGVLLTDGTLSDPNFISHGLNDLLSLRPDRTVQIGDTVDHRSLKEGFEDDVLRFTVVAEELASLAGCHLAQTATILRVTVSPVITP